VHTHSGATGSPVHFQPIQSSGNPAVGEAPLKGIIFNLLEEAVEQSFGEGAWDTVLETAKLEGAYTSLGSYPDQELLNLVAAASSVLNKSTDEILRWFGVTAIPLLAAKYPVFFVGHTGTRSFLLTLNDIIHPEVRKLYPGADVPDFTYRLTASGDDLVMIYESKRKLCMLAEGFIEGSAGYYKEAVTIEQVECMHRGGARCVFQIAFQKLAQ
jgi:hypothetical protein